MPLFQNSIFYRFPSIIGGLLVFLLFLVPLKAFGADGSSLSRKQMKEDLSLTYKWLRTYHPNVYLYRSRKNLDKIYKEIQRDIEDENGLADAYTFIARMLGSICDQHTYISPASTALAARQLDYVWNPSRQDFDFRGGELFAQLNTGLGSHKLVDLNGVEAKLLRNVLYQTTPKDGCSMSSSQPIDMLAPHALLPFASLTGDEQKYKARYLHSDLDEVMPALVRREPLHWIIYNAASAERSVARLHEQVLGDFGYEPYDFPNIDENSRASKQLNPGKIDFQYSDGLQNAYIRLGKLPNFDETELYLHRIFKALIRLNPQSLVLDLSQSPGGDLKTASMITAYLMPKSHLLASHIRVRNISSQFPKNFHADDQNYAKDRRKLFRYLRRAGRKNGVYKVQLSRTSFGLPHYKGKLYILVGPQTASAATLVSKYLQRERGATVIGTASLASARNYCAKPPGDFELPHSKLRLQIPRECFLNVETPKKNHGRVIPDVEIDGYPGNPLARMLSIYRKGFQVIEEQSTRRNGGNL